MLRVLEESCFSAAIRAIIVRVLPKPIGSATMPPQNWGGCSVWHCWVTLLMKLEWCEWLYGYRASRST